MWWKYENLKQNHLIIFVKMFKAKNRVYFKQAPSGFPVGTLKDW